LPAEEILANTWEICANIYLRKLMMLAKGENIQPGNVELEKKG
jgi:hypothetical protein